MKKHDDKTKIKLKDLAEGSLLIDNRDRMWVVEDIIDNRIVISPSWGRNHYTKAINIGHKGWLYGFYLY